MCTCQLSWFRTIFYGEPYLPMFIRDIDEFKKIQSTFKTIGEFFESVNREEAKEEAEWQKARNEYLKTCGTWM